MYFCKRRRCGGGGGGGCNTPRWSTTRGKVEKKSDYAYAVPSAPVPRSRVTLLADLGQGSSRMPAIVKYDPSILVGARTGTPDRRSTRRRTT